MMSYKYRRDIDGLRALAVIPVVLFHSGYELFSGGYVGVDIFFVISGYLITRILLKDIHQDNFSIVEFYHRRIKRIFPALFAVLIITTLVSMWLMFPGEFKKYQGSLLSTLLFYSNYFFMFDVGYFDGPAESKPLLHMWSLGVEEQFYVFFPIYLYLVHRFFKQHSFKLTVFFLLASLLYAVLLTHYAPSDAFYSTLARAWELLVGSVLAFLVVKEVVIGRRLGIFLSFVGLIAILYSIVFFTHKTPFPGLSALLPVLGSAAIILAGSNGAKGFVMTLLSSRPMVFIGLISYSLYLWHWPLLVLFKKYSFGQETPFEIALLIGLMILMAYLSWRFIEGPFRKGVLYKPASHVKLTVKGFVIVGLIAVVVVMISIKYKRTFPDDINKILMAAKNDNKPLKLESCEVFKTETNKRMKSCKFGDMSVNPSFAVLGDSHANMLLAGLDASAKRNHKSGIISGSGGCLALVGNHQIRQGFKRCKDKTDAFIKYLEVNPNIKHVVLISRWSIYANSDRYKNTKGSKVYIKDDLTQKVSKEENLLVFERSFKKTIDAISQLNLNLILVSQVPESEWGSRDIALGSWLNKKLEFRPLLQEYLERQRNVQQVFDKYQKEFGYQIVYPHELMCDKTHCEVLDEGASIYLDNNHITRDYSLKISFLFDDLFR